MAQASKLATQKLDSISFDALLSQENPFDGAISRFDLSGIRLITPSALVELAAACFALAATRAPSGDHRRWRERPGLFAPLQLRADHPASRPVSTRFPRFQREDA